MAFARVGGVRLEYEKMEPAEHSAPTIVFLHEGLGSVSLWKDFPALVAGATGCGVLNYSRQGYGRSDLITTARRPDYMHREALEVLPALLDHLDIDNPILLGHSDGASIALIHAGAHARAVRGIIVEAPHVFVENLSIASIEAARVAYETTDLAARLGRYHADPDHAFRGWNDIWLHPDFRAWNIEEYLPRIDCPVLAIQGRDDEYGTLAQLEAIERKVKGRIEIVVLPDCGHSPHRDQPQATLTAVTRFVAALQQGSTC